MKNLFIHFRTSIKLLLLIIVGLALIGIFVFFVYQPIYKVSLGGEAIGYTENKADLQARINEYIKSGDSENIAFVEITDLPNYQMCLLKKGNEPNDDEVFQTVIATGVPYYKYYAIMQDSEEKMYVKTFEEAENIINELKAKNSANKDSITYALKYEKEMKEMSDTNQVIAALYKEPVVEEPKQQTTAKSQTKTSESFSTSYKVAYEKTSLGITLTKPIAGGYTITSRFGKRSRGLHTGLDIASPSGTPIKATAAGKVIYAGWKGSYGNLVIISHGNGVQTYYAHCSKIYVTAGQSVSQGETISAVGNTGNSTGPHLHLEVRVNGVAQNPQNYLY